MNVFDRVEFLLAQKQWKRTDLMRHIGKDRALYDEWKAAGKMPDEQYAPVAQALDTTIAYLRGEVDVPQSLYGQAENVGSGVPPGSMPMAGGDGPALPPPLAERIQQVQRICQSLHGLDAKGLYLVEGLIALYKTR